MSEKKHTPTPWMVNKRGDIGNEITQQGVVMLEGIWGTSLEQISANAEHIVRCVNAHDRLVDALRAIAALSNAPTRHVDDYGGDIARSALRDAGIEVSP